MLTGSNNDGRRGTHRGYAQATLGGMVLRRIWQVLVCHERTQEFRTRTARKLMAVSKKMNQVQTVILRDLMKEQTEQLLTWHLQTHIFIPIQLFTLTEVFAVCLIDWVQFQRSLIADLCLVVGAKCRVSQSAYSDQFLLSRLPTYNVGGQTSNGLQRLSSSVTLYSGPAGSFTRTGQA